MAKVRKVWQDEATNFQLLYPPLMILLYAGLFLSLLGSLPPGLISLSVSQTSITKGLTAALTLALGASVAEFFQAWSAVCLTDWFLSHHETERIFRWAAVPVFFVAGIYLLFVAKSVSQPVNISKRSWSGQFLKGVVISLFNLLAIPYWFVYCGWLRVEGWWEPGLFSTLIFSLGVSIGTMLALLLYAWLGQLLLMRSGQMGQSANRIIGLIFIGLGIKLLFELLG
ncbi:MAG: LysE family translocator [Saprospiraceae bacterium]